MMDKFIWFAVLLFSIKNSAEMQVEFNISRNILKQELVGTYNYSGSYILRFQDHKAYTLGRVIWPDGSIEINPKMIFVYFMHDNKSYSAQFNAQPETKYIISLPEVLDSEHRVCRKGSLPLSPQFASQEPLCVYPVKLA